MALLADRRDPGDARSDAARAWLEAKDRVVAIDALTGSSWDETTDFIAMLGLGVPWLPYSEALAALLVATGDMAEAFEADPSPVRCGDREVRRDGRGWPEAREVSLGY